MLKAELCGSGISVQSQSWFVYLLALSDCSAFKVGFSCNPLQRIYSFSHRYFERFDLSQSLLLQLDALAQARDIEGVLKADLAEFRTGSPPWVPHQAGGHTEWFSAVYFGHAEERLRSFLQIHDVARVAQTSDFIHGELSRLASSFELWAFSQAQHVCDVGISASGGYVPTDAARSLRDWLDAYHFFDVPLFADDPKVLSFVTNSAHSSDHSSGRLYDWGC